jgi:hypothetical protein
MGARTWGRSTSRTTPCASHYSSWSAPSGCSHRHDFASLEISAADRHGTGAIPQAGEPEEVLEQGPVGADAKVPLAHRFECGHLLHAVRIEVLELQPVHE